MKIFDFAHKVSTNETNYYVSFKKMTKNSMDIWRLKNLKPFSDYDLAVKGWCEFKYKIDCAPSWSEFDNEFIVFFHER